MFFVAVKLIGICPFRLVAGCFEMAPATDAAYCGILKWPLSQKTVRFFVERSGLF